MFVGVLPSVVEVLRRVRCAIRNLLTALAIFAMVLVELEATVVIALVGATPIIVTVVGAATVVVLFATRFVTVVARLVTINGTATAVVTRACVEARGWDVSAALVLWSGIITLLIQRTRGVLAGARFAGWGRVVPGPWMM